MSFKNPTFQDRAEQAATEKQKALEQLRLKPSPDEETVAKRKAAGARRDVAQAGKAVVKKAKADAAAQAKAKAAVPVPTEADRKAARDARYAARQARNNR